MADSLKWTRRGALRAAGASLVGGTLASTTTRRVAGQTSESWPQVGYDDANTGYAPENTGPVGEIGEQWSFETVGPVLSSPAVVGSTVYVGSFDRNVYALSAVDGTEQWSFDTGDGVVSSPVVADGTVYIGSYDNSVYALSAGDGTEQWSFDTGARVGSSPAVVDGIVYIGSYDNSVYALSAEDGTEQWSFDTGDGVVSSPAVVDGTVYVGRGDNSVYALSAGDGTEQWSFETVGSVLSSPAVVGSTVYVGSFDRNVYALSAEDGTEQWSFDTGDYVSSPAVVDDTVYVGSLDWNVYALSAEDGTEQWAFDTGAGVRSSPAVVDGTVYVGSNDNSVYALSAGDGTEQWSFDTGAGVGSSPAVVDGTVYVGSDDNSVYAIAPQSDGGSDGGSGTTVGTNADTDGGSDGGGGATGGTSTDFDGGSDTMLGLAGVAGALGVGGGLWYWQRSGGDDSSTTQGTTETTGGDDPGGTSSDEGTDTRTEESYRVNQNANVDETREESLRDRLNSRRDSVRQELEQAADLVDADPEAARERLSGLDSRIGTLEKRVVDAGFADLRADLKRLESERADLVAEAEMALRGGAPERIPRAPDVSVDYDALTDEEPIGAGGNADVVRATLPTPEGDVILAIKRPRMSGTLHTDAVERMLAEAETWDKLDDHDHVVGVVDYGAEPIPWIAMEYMDAGDLGDRAGELSFDQALWTAVSIAEGVRHAHRRGIAHLDLKPANVLFRGTESAWDVPKVADWGLSKHLLDHSKSVEGLSPQYAAPEQFDDGYGATDDITDVYQLGAVFYELFTGHPPFEGEPAKAMHRVLHEDPRPPSELADVPAELDDVLLTALAKGKPDRFESVLYFRDALRRLSEDCH